MIYRRNTYANPTVGIIAAGLHLFGRGRGHFCHLQSALPDHNARITIDIDRSIVRRVRVQYRKGSGSYTEVWGICFSATARPRSPANDCKSPEPWRAAANRPLLLLPVAGIEQFRSRGTASIGPLRAIQLPIFPAKCSSLVAGETRDALQWCFMSTALHHPKRTSKEND